MEASSSRVDDGATMKKSVEEQLYFAAKVEDLPHFDALYHQHPFVVEQTVYSGSRNLLHIATAEGKARIVGLLVKKCPQLAERARRQTVDAASHAAAKGHVGIAGMLLSVAPKMCWRLDDHDMNPVHVAAANGHVDVLRLLIEHDLSSGMELLEGRRSVLSLIVKRRKLAALTFLVETYPDLVLEQDVDGETILSFAIKYKYPEIIAYLSRHKAFRHITRHITTMIRNTTVTSSVVMGLVAQMAYAASLRPPGGYWQDTTSSHKAGKVVVTSTHSGLYKLFVRSNNTTYVSALLVIFLINIIPPQTSIIYTLAVLLETIVALGGVSLGNCHDHHESSANTSCSSSHYNCRCCDRGHLAVGYFHGCFEECVHEIEAAESAE